MALTWLWQVVLLGLAVPAVHGDTGFHPDSAGRTTRETLEDGSSAIDYAYQTVGSLVTQTTVTDPLGRKTEYRFSG